MFRLQSIVLLLVSLVLASGCTNGGQPGANGTGGGNKASAGSEGGAIAGAKPAGVKVYKAPADFFADMPKEVYPRGGSSGRPDREAAQEWVTKNCGDRQIEWTAKIHHVTPHKNQDGSGYRVDVYFGGANAPRPWFVQWGSVKFGGHECSVLIPSLTYDNVDLATFRKIREWEGKTATFRARITDSWFESEDGPSNKIECALQCSRPTIDGYAPPSVKE